MAKVLRIFNIPNTHLWQANGFLLSLQSF